MKKVLSILLIFVAPMLIGQNDCNHSISGYVLDKHNNEPLMSATITLPAISKLVYTDSVGFFEIKGLCHGNYRVICSHLGCSSIEDTIHIDGNVKHNFYPEHHAEELEGVVIRVDNKSSSSTSVVEILDEEELFKSSGNSLGNTLKNSTGVTTLSTSGNIDKPVIRGFHSNRVLIVNNGVRQESQQWGSEHAPEIDTYTSNSVEIIKGAGSLKYGSDAIGGVILLKPKPLLYTNGLEGELNLSAKDNNHQLSSSLRIDGSSKQIKGLGFRAIVTSKQAGNYKTYRYYVDNTGFKELNYLFALGFKRKNWGSELYYSSYNGKVGIYSGAHISNTTDLMNAFNANEPLVKSNFTYDIARPYQDLIHNTLHYRVYILPNDSSKINFEYAYQENARREYDSHEDEGAQFDFNLGTHLLNLFYIKKHKRLTTEFGVNSSLQQNIWKGRYFIPNFEKIGAGIFITEKFKISDNQTITAGARWDFSNLDVYRSVNGKTVQTSHSFTNYSGSVGYFRKISKQLNFTFNLGSAWRPPSINELYSEGLHHGSAAIEIGDQNLKSEKVYSVNIGLNGDYKGITLQVQPYYNFAQDFIYLNPQKELVLTIQGAYPVFKYEQVNANLYGLDAASEIALSNHLDLNIKYSLIRAKYNNIFIYGIPSDRIASALKYKIPNGKFWKNSFLELEGLHVFKQFRVDQNVDFVPAPNAYYLINFAAGSDVFIAKQKFKIGFSINNILNTGYRDYMNRYRYFVDGMGRVFNIKLKVPFHSHFSSHSHKH